MSEPKKTRKKRGRLVLRFRKNDPTHNLHAAVQHWVVAKGGDLLLTSGPEVQDWHDGALKFRVAIACVGRAPKPEKTLEPRKER